MEVFQKLATPISTSGRPSYCTGEVEVLQQEGVGFYDGEKRDSHENGTVYLTSHRLVWVEATKDVSQCVYCALSALSQDVRRWFGLGSFSHPKLLVYLAKPSSAYFKISFRKYGMDVFCTALTAALKAQAWKTTPIKNFSLLTPAKPAAPKDCTVTLTPEKASLEGDVFVVTESIGSAAKLALKGLGKGPLSKAVFHFVCDTAGTYELTVHYSSAEAVQALTVRANANAGARIDLQPNTSSENTLVLLEKGKNALAISPVLSQLAERPPPEAVHRIVLVPVSGARGNTKGSGSASTMGGINGIVTKFETQDASESAKMSDAVRDIDALMGMAEDLSTMLTQIQTKISSSRGANREEQDEIDVRQAELNMLVAELGMSSVVTRDSVGTGSYTTELAKHLLDFLQVPLERQNGTMSILDAFCLYNMARGTNLVSPDDMWKACKLLQSLPGSNIQFIEVGSTKLLRLDNVAGDTKLQAMLNDAATCLTPLALAARLKVSARVAHEILEDAELRGVVCRDAQHPDGVSFHKNIFLGK